MKWLTNCSKHETNRVITELTLGHKTRVLTTAEPKSSDTYTSAELEAMGLVGIYEVRP